MFNKRHKDLTPEEKRQYNTQKKREERLRDPERCRENTRRWNDSHREQVRERDRKRHRGNPKHIKASIEWKRSHPEKARANAKRYAHKRKANLHNTISDLTDHEWNFCKRWFISCCAYCLKYCEKLEQDHFVPVSKSGAHTMNNIVPACPSCNRSKNHRNAEDWLIWKFGTNHTARVLMEIYDYFEHVS